MSRERLEQIRNDINSKFPDNSTGFITPARLREVTRDIVDSCYSEKANVINVIEDLGDPVGDVYSLDPGYYEFSEDINFGTSRIELTGSGRYFFNSSNLVTLTYEGTGEGASFISCTVPGALILVNNLEFVSSGRAFDVSDIDGLFIESAFFTNCATSALCTNVRSVNIERISQFGSGLGMVFNSCDVVGVGSTQYDIRANTLDSTAFSFSGEGSRVLISRIEGKPGSLESMVYIDPAYTGEVTIDGGVFDDSDGGDFFASGSKTGQDLGVFVSQDMRGVRPSRSIGSFSAQGNAAATVIASSGVYYDLNLGTLAEEGDNIERWQLNDTTTGELECLEDDFSGVVEATISAYGLGGDSEYHFRVIKNGIQVGALTANELTSTMGNTGLIVPITADAGDLIKLQVANITNTSNITVKYITANIA